MLEIAGGIILAVIGLCLLPLLLPILAIVLSFGVLLAAAVGGFAMLLFVDEETRGVIFIGGIVFVIFWFFASRSSNPATPAKDATPELPEPRLGTVEHERWLQARRKRQGNRR